MTGAEFDKAMNDIVKDNIKAFTELAKACGW